MAKPSSFKNKKIFITHCSAKKNPVFKNTKAKVTPDKLYTATPTQRFMNECKDKGVNWAIFSDKYGVWFSNIQHEWYEKNPNKITEAEFNQLVSKFNKSLGQFDVFRYSFDLKLLPKNGVYFFYEEGENSEHSNGIDRPRIVRIGTHKENNFRSRISEHFLLNESKMKFTQTNPKPSDRSIFRKNIGRALLNKQKDIDYLKVWETGSNNTKWSL